MINIAFIMQHLDNAAPPVENGSVAIWIYHVATQLALERPDYAVRIYGFQNNLFRTRVMRYKNVTYYFLPSFVNYMWEKILRIARAFKKFLFIQGKNIPARHARDFAAATYALGYILPIAWHLKSHPCQVIHVSNFTQFVPVIRFFNPQSKIVLHMHCEWVSQLSRKIMEPRLAKTQLILGCSSYITQKIKAAYPSYQGQIQTVHNGVDMNHFQTGFRSFPAKNLCTYDSRRQEREIRLLFVGRISPEKGLHTLVEAFNKIVAAAYRIRLDIIGDERMLPRDFIVDLSESRNIKALARYYVNTDNRYYAALLRSMITPAAKPYVNFIGPVPHSQVAYYYRQADILVNPSLSESFGISLIEALACGLVIVATRIGGMRDIIEHGKTGLLVDPESPDELAAALRRLIDNRALFSYLQRISRSYCLKNFSWPKITADLLTVYRKSKLL